jgi:TetR/AcrR family transcriptional repressor of nem operon
MAIVAEASAPQRSTKGEATREQILAAAERLMLEHGYAATSLDDILAETGLTKGAFFYHFRGKVDLARAMIQRYSDNDQKFFRGLVEAAESRSSDPLESVLIFLTLFEEHFRADTELSGCVFATYSYESGQFDPEVLRLVAQGFIDWKNIYRDKFAKLIAIRPPRLPATADDLASTIAAIVQGGFILARSLDDRGELIRPAIQFRNYLRLLFGD